MDAGDIKLEMLTSINMELKERTKEKVRAADNARTLARRVGNTFLRRFKDGNLCVTRASILLGFMNPRETNMIFCLAFFFEHC